MHGGRIPSAIEEQEAGRWKRMLLGSSSVLKKTASDFVGSSQVVNGSCR